MLNNFMIKTKVMVHQTQLNNSIDSDALSMISQNTISPLKLRKYLNISLQQSPKSQKQHLLSHSMQQTQRNKNKVNFGTEFRTISQNNKRKLKCENNEISMLSCFDKDSGMYSPQKTILSPFKCFDQQYENMDKSIKTIPIKLILGLYKAKCVDNQLPFAEGDFNIFKKCIKKRFRKQKLDLSNFSVKYNSSKVLALILQLNNHFIELNLSHNIISNMGWEEITKGILNHKTQSIIHINLSNCAMNPQACSVFIGSLSSLYSLISLNLHKNHLGLKGGEAMGDFLMFHKTIQFLNISMTQMGDGIQAIFEGLSQNKSLISLDMSNNQVLLQDMVQLKQVFFGRDWTYQYDFLVELNIHNNLTKNKKAFVLSEILKEKQWRLRKLNLKNNRMKWEGISMILDALMKHQYIEQLDISFNSFKEYKNFSLLSFLQSNSSIRQLDLQSCNLNESAIVNIKEGLGINHSLQKLVLSNNNLGVQGCIFISEGTISNKNLLDLDLSNCNIQDLGAQYLIKNLKNRRFPISFLNISNNNIQEEGGSKILEYITAIQENLNIELKHNIFSFKLDQMLTQQLQRKQEKLKAAVSNVLSNQKKNLNAFIQLNQESIDGKDHLFHQADLIKQIEQAKNSKEQNEQKYQKALLCIQNKYQRCVEELKYLFNYEQVQEKNQKKQMKKIDDEILNQEQNLIKQIQVNEELARRNDYVQKKIQRQMIPYDKKINQLMETLKYDEQQLINKTLRFNNISTILDKIKNPQNIQKSNTEQSASKNQSFSKSNQSISKVNYSNQKITSQFKLQQQITPQQHDIRIQF